MYNMYVCVIRRKDIYQKILAPKIMFTKPFYNCEKNKEFGSSSGEFPGQMITCNETIISIH